MKTRERLLTALANKKADRLPGQVHNWMEYYLNTYLKGMSDYEAYDYFGLDSVIYVGWGYGTNSISSSQWDVKEIPLGRGDNDNDSFRIEITTPEGILSYMEERNPYTNWITEYPIRNESDFELFRKYFPVSDIDPAPVIAARDKIGDNGIVRGYVWCFGQPGPWQDFTCLLGTQPAIEAAIDKPEWVHYCLNELTSIKIRHIEKMNTVPYDLIENGGGGASTTVISPKMFREFCIPYDRKIHDALHELDLKVTYHICGGLMPILEDIVENNCDAIETFTPSGLGGDTDLSEAYLRIGKKVAFIGGFDQLAGFERGTPERAKELVLEAFEAAGRDGGFILSPSDHFFFGDTKNIQAFSDAIKECSY